jgi:uncharacterized RDD family membrane protein YckC
MIRAAQYEDGAEDYQATGTEGGGELQQLAAERLAAHRRRRAVVEGRAARARREAAGLAPDPEQAVQPDAARVRDAVVARYRESQSYREFLAEEAQRALERAQAEAEVAARNARAVAEARRVLLQEIEQWNQAQGEQERSQQAQRRPAEAQDEFLGPAIAAPPVPLQVRLHEPLGPAMVATSLHAPAKRIEYEDEELAQLDDEIEFRLAGGFEGLDLEVQPIQGNIIEFPRQLVASRKVRPRLAEGPLLEEAPPEPQLRIFEVEPEQVAVEPEIVVDPEAPEWQSLRLGSEAFAQTLPATQPLIEHELHVATVGERFLSATLDFLLVAAGLVGAGAAAVKVAGEAMRGAPLLSIAISAGGAMTGFLMLYRLLFFTLNEATPGMRAMRLAFCTFDEQSPTRKAVRRRMFATLLAVCPLGLGLVWMILDSDRLGWHDRMSHMYPRGY